MSGLPEISTKAKTKWSSQSFKRTQAMAQSRLPIATSGVQKSSLPAVNLRAMTIQKSLHEMGQDCIGSKYEKRKPFIGQFKLLLKIVL